MKMKRCTAAILLVLSLEALVAGRLSAAVVVNDGADTILLPSQGLADELVTAARENSGEVKRPWKCCDHTFCNRKMPPGCRCMDPVERCDKACSRCEKLQSDPSKHICMDRYTGDPGPTCTKPGNGEEDASPWKCCDLPRCTKSFPPICQCLDKVKKCAKTCKNCEKAVRSNGASSRYVCRDTYGKLAPPCTKSVASGPGVAGHEEASSTAVAATEEVRAWKCCDPACAIKIPVTARCPYPGRDLGNGVGDDIHDGPGVAGQEATAGATETEEPRLLNSTGPATTESEKSVTGKSIADGEEQARPWKCCDDTLCTRSAPPTCQCLDKVNMCAKTCKSCEKADGLNGASSQYVCHDRYFGWPGPKCKSGIRRGN